MSCLIPSSVARFILKAISGATLYVNLTAVLVSLGDFTEYLIFFFNLLEQNIYLNGVSVFISLYVISLLFVIIG